MLENHKRPDPVNQWFSATLSGNMFLSTLVEVVQPPACTTTWSPPNMKAFTNQRSVTGVMSTIPLAPPLWQRHARGFTWSASGCCTMMGIVSYFCCPDDKFILRWTLSVHFAFLSLLAVRFQHIFKKKKSPLKVAIPKYSDCKVDQAALNDSTRNHCVKFQQHFMHLLCEPLKVL